jgi:hypothetical protein
VGAYAGLGLVCWLATCAFTWAAVGSVGMEPAWACRSHRPSAAIRLRARKCCAQAAYAHRHIRDKYAAVLREVSQMVDATCSPSVLVRRMHRRRTV